MDLTFKLTKCIAFFVYDPEFCNINYNKKCEDRGVFTSLLHLFFEQQSVRVWELRTLKVKFFPILHSSIHVFHSVPTFLGTVGTVNQYSYKAVIVKCI